MNISKNKVKIVETYNHLLSLLPAKLANQLIWVDRDVNWSISIYEGTNFLNLQPTSAIKNPAISRKDVTDAFTAFVADPFMVRVQYEWLMFFEVFNQQKDRGEIAFARSKNGYKWNYQQIILSEDFHLSYPYVFEFESNWYMMPESCEANSVRLYQATNFPDRWELVSEILVGSRFVDASMLHFEDIWWLFVGVEPTKGASCNMLKLYYADNLLDRWVEHPMSPIVSNNSKISRPAGRIRQIDGKLVRFAQDCTVTYGHNVSAIQIESLTKDHYLESKILHERDYLFELGTLSFNQIGMHHLDFIMLDDSHCQACVDCR
ncbi:MAG: hypothetical protein LH474_02870 [Chamaesiphon sp.]|nr:hypothetical protein [Chamaesiphon sp.]